MKEYKSISIIVNTIPGLGEKLNEYAKKGWYIKDTITNGIHCGENSEYIYLLERDEQEPTIDQSQVIHREPDMIKENKSKPEKKPTPPSLRTVKGEARQ